MTTARFALVGDPIAHSASPRMHAAAYAALGLDCTYEAIHATEQDLPDVIDRLKRDELQGLNVTVPHKRRVLAYADAVDASAETVGVANTLVREAGGSVVAHNTDVPAIADELRRLGLGVGDERWTTGQALVLGTGATARSSVVALGAHLGVPHVTVRGRAVKDGVARERLQREFDELLARAGSRSVVRLEPWSAAATTDRALVAIVQATSLGMEGADPGAPAAEAVAWGAVSIDCVALDVVTRSPLTPFLRAAEARGLRMASGHGMLARQGALAFELWFNRPAPIEAMRAALDA